MKHNHTIARHTVSRETFSAVDRLIREHRPLLERYLKQLLWWNDRINLVSRDVPRETIWEHIRHSLLLSQFEPFKTASLVVDAGTGGGLPGMPLAITAPDKTFVLNDLVAKKMMAVRQMARKLPVNNVTLSDGSFEDLEISSPFLLVSKHAFKVHRLWEMAEGKPWSSMVFFKGIEIEEELDEIDESLLIDIFTLDSGSDNTFYEGKGIVAISRNTR